MDYEKLLNLLKQNLKFVLEHLAEKNHSVVLKLLDENEKIIKLLEKKNSSPIDSKDIQECIHLQNLVDIELQKETLELKNEIHILEFKKLKISKSKLSGN
jgi:hypothetical protein